MRLCDDPPDYRADPPAADESVCPVADEEPTTAPDHHGVRPVDLRDYADCQPRSATRTRVFRTDRLAIDLWCVEPRTSTGVLHLEDQDVAYTIIGGRSWIVTDNGEVGLDPMGSILIPADTVHGIDNRSPDPLIVLAASAPPDAEEPGPAIADDAEAVTWGAEPGVVRRAVDALFGGRSG